MPEKIYLLLCILYFSHCNVAVNPAREDPATDSSIRRSKELINLLVSNEEMDSALRYTDELRFLAEQKGSGRLMQNYWNCRGYVYKNMERFDSAAACYQQAKQLAQQGAGEESEKDLWTANAGLASVLESQGKYMQSFELYRALYTYKKEHSDTAGIDYVAYNLGILASQMGNQEMRKKYLTESLTSPRTTRGLITAVAAELQGYYMEIEKFDSADYYFNTYIYPDTILNSPIDLAAKDEGIGLILVRKDSTAEALKYFQKALRQQAIENGIGLSQCYMNAAQAASALKKYDLAVLYADSAVLAARKEDSIGFTTNQNILVQALELKATSRGNIHQYGPAYHALSDAFREYKSYADSSYAKEVKELEEQYADREKDQQISTLAKDKETALQLNRQQRIITIGAFTLFGVLGLSGILFYRRSKLKDQFDQMDLEQRFLRSQMEPHFLFNVLGVLQRFIRSDQKEKSINYLSSFANLLRTNLENSRKTYVPLTDEISALKSYLNMQSMGQDSNFDYVMDIFEDEEMDDIFIYPMIIQPFVENAVQHGIKNLSYRGKLQISILKYEDYLECIIEDNGVGLPPSAGPVKDTNPGKSSLAIQITRERLALLSRKTKKDFTLLLQNREEAGTIVRIRIPYLYQ